MDLIPKKNFIILLAAALVVAFGVMSLHMMSKRTANLKQSAAEYFSNEPTPSYIEPSKELTGDSDELQYEDPDESGNDSQTGVNEVETSF